MHTVREEDTTTNYDADDEDDNSLRLIFFSRQHQNDGCVIVIFIMQIFSPCQTRKEKIS